jgi:hypothetical protein
MSFDDAITNDESGDRDGGKPADPEKDFRSTDALMGSRGGAGSGGRRNHCASDLGVIRGGNRRSRRLGDGRGSWRRDNRPEHPTLSLDPVGVGGGVLLAGLVPGLGFQEGDAHRPLPEFVIHDRVSGHPRNALENERDVAFDLVVAGPDRDGVRELLVSVVRRGPPEIKLGTDPLHIGGEYRDVVALPFAIVEGDGFGLRAPFSSKGATPHGAGVLVPN